jgi:hypothetical protein
MQHKCVTAHAAGEGLPWVFETGYVRRGGAGFCRDVVAVVGTAVRGYGFGCMGVQQQLVQGAFAQYDGKARKQEGSDMCSRP